MTPRTAQRIAALRRLIGQFGKRDLSRYEVAAFLKTSKRSTGDHLHDLQSAGIISAVGPRFRLIADAEQVAAFLSQGEARDQAIKPLGKLHFFSREERCRVHVHVGSAAPDPLALPAGFFGRTMGAAA
jgi:hypothetical protein